VEYEGRELSSREGILKTKALADKTWNTVWASK
jgi:hypothetical protein